MRSLIAITGVRLDGQRFAPTKPFSASDEIADALIALGSAREAEPDGAGAGDGADARAAAIEQAVAELTADDWTAEGLPKVAAVSKAAGLKDLKAVELAGFKKPDA